MPKKREVASLVGNFSPVKRRRAILVRSMRHLRGETGEVLNTRAVEEGCIQYVIIAYEVFFSGTKLTLLKDTCPINFDDASSIVLVLFVRHVGRVDKSSAVRHGK